MRDNPYPYTSDQLFHKLLQGVKLPSSCANLSGSQHSLLLSPQQIADDQQSPPFGVQFPADSFANTFPILMWWLMLTLLGALAYPLIFFVFRGLSDHGYIFSKTLGILLLAYSAFFLKHWLLLLIEEVIFTLAFLVLSIYVHSIPIFGTALLGGFFAALIGNLDGVLQLKDQFLSLLAKLQPPNFDYWRSSRIIPFTLNEFPFRSFLFADLHPHVIDLPIAVLMLGVVGLLLLASDERNGGSGERRWGNILLYLFAAFTFGTIACVNPWDMPVYALLLGVVLLLRKLQELRGKPKIELLFSLGFTLLLVVSICGLGYLFYLPFYATYQQLYVNGLGLVSQGTDLKYYLITLGYGFLLCLASFCSNFIVGGGVCGEQEQEFNGSNYGG